MSIDITNTEDTAVIRVDAANQKKKASARLVAESNALCAYIQKNAVALARRENLANRIVLHMQACNACETAIERYQ